MASIFNKKPQPKTPAPSEQRFADIELSISNRYKSLDDKIDSRMNGLDDRFKRLDQQVTELLKRTYDGERRNEERLIDFDAKLTAALKGVNTKLEDFYSDFDKKFPRREELLNQIDDVAGTIRGIKSEIDETNKTVKVVEAKIPKDTAKKKSVEDAIATLNDAIMKVANAIPKNTASTDLVADIRKEIIKTFDSYATTDALKSVAGEVNNKIEKVAKTSATTSKLSKKTQTDFNKVASTVKDIKADYVPQSVIPSINQEIVAAKQELLKSDQEVIAKIPTKFAKPIEIENLQNSIRTLSDVVAGQKIEISKEVSISKQQVDKIVKDAMSYFDSKVKDLETVFAEESGIDSNHMKNIIREIADAEISSLRNQAMLLQENTKQSLIEVKNQNRNLASKISEMQKDFLKVVKLSNISK